jgi:hypothetical protein
MKKFVYSFLIVLLSVVFMSFEANADIVPIVKSDSNDINYLTKHLTTTQLFALAMYGETRGESEAGKIAMGTVVLLRVEELKLKGIKNPLRKVLLTTKAFSCFNNGESNVEMDPNFPLIKRIALNWKYSYKNSYSLKHCYLIASCLLDGTLKKNELLVQYNVTNYQVVGHNSKWSRAMIFVVVIDNHEFYTEKKNVAYLQVVNYDKTKISKAVSFISTIGNFILYDNRRRIVRV